MIRKKLKSEKGLRFPVMPAILLAIMVTGSCLWSVTLVHAVEKKDKEFTIVLDPGHGGAASGADRDEVLEKDLNLKIGKYLKEELEKYEKVKVYLTRESDRDVDLDERSRFCKEVGADLMVSLHNNAAGDIAAYYNGSNILTSNRQFREEIGLEEQELAVNILHELTRLGLEDQGILLRTSQNGETYPNGELADYYRLVKNGILQQIPSIIVEHAFLDDDGDYEEFLSDDNKLKDLARADARGIARYYGLKSKKDGTVLDPLSNIKEKKVLVVDEDYRHNIISYETYFQDERNEKEGKQTDPEVEAIIKKICSCLIPYLQIR